MKNLINDILNCKFCEEKLPLGANPVIRVSPTATILIIGQAPGTKVHQTGIPWNDPSGDQLRKWLNIAPQTFYDETQIAIVPMGFCYPGKGKSGDLPPRKECAPLWHQKILKAMPNIQLTLLIGQYAQKYYLNKTAKNTLTETVQNFQEYLPDFFPLPHPSPRNRFWLKKNLWFEDVVLPALKERIADLINKSPEKNNTFNI